jgi:hypothetical protein
MLVLAAARTTVADFDTNTVTLAMAELSHSMEVPVFQSSLTKDGIQSQFLFNDSQVNWGKLEGLMFGQIRVLQGFGNYYHLWAGFEDGSFLGYYDKGKNAKAPDQNQYTISYQSSANHSCPQYNYTIETWNKTIGENIDKSGVKYSPPPPDKTGHYIRSFHKKQQPLPLQRFCREYFMADPNSGKMVDSWGGAVYDARKRGWYFNTKTQLTSRWSGMYVDRSTNEPAFAFCVPLTNLTTRQPIPVRLVDKNGLVGVACTGMYISDMSKGLAETFTNFEEHGVYVREASSGLLVATSASATSGSSMQAYYDSTAQSRILPTASPDKLIRWSAGELIKNNSGTCGNWPCDGTTFVKWVNNSYESTVPGLTSIHKGDAFYINTQDFKQNGLSWQVIAVQKVDCPVGYEVDTEKFVCKECISPASSAGGSSQCTLCIQGYYYNKAHKRCETCPSDNAICKGGSALPYPKQGYWMDTSKEEYLADEPMCCSREFVDGQETCVITENCQGGADFFDLCFSSPERLDICNTKSHVNFTSTDKIMCGEGASGQLCDICISPNYYDNDGKCSHCEGNVGPLIAIMAAFVACVLIAFIVYHKYGDYIAANYPLIIGAIFDTGRMKVFFANVQIIGSVSWSTGVSWPMPFSLVSKLGSVLELNFIDVLPLSCMPGPGYSFYAYAITNTAGPLAFNAALFFLMQSEIRVASHKSIVHKKGLCSSYLGNPNFVWFAILMVFYIFLPTSTLALVRIFHCTDFPDGTSWLDADLALQCTEKNGEMTAGHVAMVVYAVIMLIIWAIGVPGLFFTLLNRQHEDIVNYDKEQDTMECPEALQPLKFLFFHYKPENYNAEWKECARRILLMGGVAVIPSTSRAEKAFAGTVIALVFAVWDRERAPWDDPFTNTLMNGFDWVVYFVFLGAFTILSGEVDQTAISYVLFFLSIGIFGVALKFQFEDFRKNTELLALKGQIANFRENVVGIAYVKRTMRGFERQRFLNGDWAMDINDMSKEQRVALIQQTSTDLAHLRDDNEIDNFLEVQKHFHATGERTDWYWQEESHHRSKWDPSVIHPDDNLLTNENKIWVQYSPAVTAQLEKVFLDGKKGLKVNPIIAVDLEGRVVGTDDHAGANGLRYSVDTKRMMQINARTGCVSKRMAVHLSMRKLIDPVSLSRVHADTSAPAFESKQRSRRRNLKWKPRRLRRTSTSSTSTPSPTGMGLARLSRLTQRNSMLAKSTKTECRHFRSTSLKPTSRCCSFKRASLFRFKGSVMMAGCTDSLCGSPKP